MNSSDEKMCQEIVKYVREAASPSKIVLFGSRARGDAHEDSDYDLLVVKDEIESYSEETHEIGVALMTLPIFADVLLRTSEEDKRKQQLQIGLQRSVMEEGIVLYERGVY